MKEHKMKGSWKIKIIEKIWTRKLSHEEDDEDDGLEDVEQKKMGQTQIRRSAKKHQDKNVCSIKCERGQGRIKVDKFKEM